jgi:LPS export ABC transporter protein LptC
MYRLISRGFVCPLLVSAFVLALPGCTFDYGAAPLEDENQPDIVMSDVEYVRVRDGDPVVRFVAESVERFEKKQTMELKKFSFEQFESHGEDINAVGTAETASVDLESGNISMREGVRIDVDSEDLTIETKTLQWQDKERALIAGEYEPVDIKRSDGTSFSGQGFSADARRRTWIFSSGVEGTYIDTHDDDGEEENEEGEEYEDQADLAAGEGETGDFDPAGTDLAQEDPAPVEDLP